MIIEAPAKVNLHLAVLDKRPDGFHNLESLFAAVDFGDSLHFQPKTGGKNGLELIINGPAAAKLAIPAEKNIIFRALDRFRERTGYNEGLEITLEKRIPVGGGLGGGSSDAAGTLLALNELAGFPLERFELLELGASLGSDVPFFIHRVSAAWVTGRGEYIEPLEPPSWHFVLVNPGFSSDTGNAFKLLDESRGQVKSEKRKVKSEEEKGFSSDNFFHSSLLTPHSSLYNDFLAFLPQKSTYNRIINQLIQLKADYANLSGSGSTCFGAFREKEQAERAALSLKNEWEFVQSCGIKKY